MGDVIEEGDYVVLVKNFDSGNMKIIPATNGPVVHYGKLHFNPSPLIGAQFGQVFEIKGDTMEPVDNFEDFDIELSDIVAQRMSTINVKSQFSQEKIIKKKKKKAHANVVTVMKPTLLHINEMLFARDKIGGLRADVLGQIITLSNVQSGSKCVILDHNLGMITSAVLSRILPDGVCIQVVSDHESMNTTRKTVNMLNIKETECKDHLLAITIRDLHKVSKGIETFEQDNDILQNQCKEHLERLAYRSGASFKPASDDVKRTKLEPEMGEKLQKVLLKKAANREQRNRERILAKKYLRQSIDSLIIVVQNDHPIQILKMLFPFLAPSRQFVIFSDMIEPLVECQQHLKLNTLAISMQLSESWLRRYQVLPDRTRPEMNAMGYGGYILSGIKAYWGQPAIAADALMQDEST